MRRILPPIISAMRVALGADHAGVELKDALKPALDELGVWSEDFGTYGPDSVDYPDFAAAVARGVSEGRFDRGVLVCGSGIGMAITANKVAGVRAAAIGDTTAARLSREHNDLNVLAMGARTTPAPLAIQILPRVPRHALRGRPPRATGREDSFDRAWGVAKGMRARPFPFDLNIERASTVFPPASIPIRSCSPSSRSASSGAPGSWRGTRPTSARAGSTSPTEVGRRVRGGAA